MATKIATKSLSPKMTSQAPESFLSESKTNVTFIAVFQLKLFHFCEAIQVGLILSCDWTINGCSHEQLHLLVPETSLPVNIKLKFKSAPELSELLAHFYHKPCG